MEKYLIHMGDRIAAVRFNPSNQELVVGGPSRFRSDFESIMETYFNAVAGECKRPRLNIMKFVSVIDKKQFDSGLARLRSDATVEQVQSHGRLLW
jgi:hypothetical protein